MFVFYKQRYCIPVDCPILLVFCSSTASKCAAYEQLMSIIHDQCTPGCQYSYNLYVGKHCMLPQRHIKQTISFGNSARATSLGTRTISIHELTYAHSWLIVRGESNVILNIMHRGGFALLVNQSSLLLKPAFLKYPNTKITVSKIMQICFLYIFFMNE